MHAAMVLSADGATSGSNDLSRAWLRAASLACCEGRVLRVACACTAAALAAAGAGRPSHAQYAAKSSGSQAVS